MSGQEDQRSKIKWPPPGLMRLGLRVAAGLTLGFLPPLPSVAAIIENRRHLLLVKRSDRLGYCLPGGIMRWNESISEALLREVEEETGYAVRPLALWGNFSGRERDTRASTICLVYTTKVIGGHLRNSVEGTVEWVHFEDTVQIPFAFDHEKIVSDFVRGENRSQGCAEEYETRRRG